MEKIEDLHIETKKLKEGDRIFLLNRNLNEAIANSNGSMFNSSFLMSSLVLLVSGFSVIYLTGVLWFVLAYCLLSVVGLIFIIRKYKKAQQMLKEKDWKIKVNYDLLFTEHLGYAIKKD